MAASTEQSVGGPEEAVAEQEPRVLEPGAAPFGNFPQYSRFHPPEQRLRLLPPELLRRLFPQGPETKPILGLDVGCNSGVSDGKRDRRSGSPAVGCLQVHWGSGLGVTSQLSQNELKGYVPNSRVPASAASRPNPAWEGPPYWVSGARLLSSVAGNLVGERGLPETYVWELGVGIGLLEEMSQR